MDFNAMLKAGKAEIKLPLMDVDPITGERIDPIRDAIFESARIEGLKEDPRPHMGASVIGGDCKRLTWLNFRWAAPEEFEGRTLQLFDRGKREEIPVIANLRRAGFEVIDEHGDVSPIGLTNTPDGEQYRVDLGGHVSGSLDGFLKGHADAPKTWHVLEIKTHGLKSFKKLVAEGVYVSKYQHWVQMQIYMLKTGLTRALYYAVCKDNDDIYTERVKLDKTKAKQLVEDAQIMALSPRMYEPISADPSYYRCKAFKCSAYEFCHQGKQIAPVNCRTCAYSVPTPGSTWECTRYDNAEIPYEAQLRGCDEYIIHADLIPE